MTDDSSAGPAGEPELIGDAEPVRDAPAAGRWSAVSGLLDRVEGRRLAEVGAAAGVAVVVLAFVGAAMAMGGGDDGGEAPGLPAPYENSAGEGGALPGPVTTTAPSVAPSTTATGRPASTGVYVPRPTMSPTTTSPVPAPTTSRASVPVTTTKPGTPTPPPATTTPPPVTVTPTPTATDTTTPPIDPPPPGTGQ
jgi:molecular chaperone DnaK